MADRDLADHQRGAADGPRAHRGEPASRPSSFRHVSCPSSTHDCAVDDSHRTFVVVSRAALFSRWCRGSIVEHLETTYLANRDANIAFGLVGDLRASAEPTRTDDGDITEAAVRGISELNERYEAEHGVRPFHLLIRERKYNESEGCGWVGSASAAR